MSEVGDVAVVVAVFVGGLAVVVVGLVVGGGVVVVGGVVVGFGGGFNFILKRSMCSSSTAFFVILS